MAFLALQMKFGQDLIRFSVQTVACCSSHYFHFELPSFIIELGHYINQFDLYAILITVREWAPQF